MGVKERKERDRLEMRERIVQSAHNLFLDKSFEEISIRNIADAIEYSPATIYLYFKDKNEIFYALRGEAFKIFNSYVADVMSITSPFGRLIGLANKYISFTFTYPKYYNIMFTMEPPMNCDENSGNGQEGESVYQFLEAIVEACKPEGYFRNRETKIISFTIWSFMHGMCSPISHNRMRIYEPGDREAIRIESLKQFMDLLKLT
jgi:AcrR family transcriptional regulator